MYVKQGSDMHVALLETSNPFDRVDRQHIGQTQIYVFRLLSNEYINQSMYIR